MRKITYAYNTSVHKSTSFSPAELMYGRKLQLSYLLTDPGVLPILDPHSKLNIIHGTLNFNFPSPPSKRKVLDYNSAKI